MSLLGIDIGTTGCKAAAFSDDGRCLASAYREYPTASPQPGWAELDSPAVFELVKAAIAEAAAAAAGAGDPVAALGISSMGEATTPVSADRRILGPSILMSDSRGGRYVDALRRDISQEDFYAINPNILAASYSMPKLCWLRDHQGDLYRRADWFLHWADLVAFLLGGRAATNYSHANRTLLFDLRAADWSDRLIALAGLDRAKLAPCTAPGTVVGTVRADLAGELGLRAVGNGGGVAIVLGGHDQCCNALGTGIVRSGGAVCGIGTYQCITPVYDRIPDAAFMLAHGLNIEHHVLPGLYVSFLYNQGGSLVRWFRDTFAGADRRLADLAGRALDRPSGERANLYDLLAGEMPAEPTSLLTLPHFDVTGPPLFTAESAGVILGLRTSTTRGEILKSIMESVALYFVESFEALRAIGIDTSEFVATGGGARSDPWLQIQADIFGVPFVRPRVTEASTLGAALLAGLATGVFRSPDEAVGRFVQRERVFHPDPARHAVYRRKLSKYRQLQPLLRDILAPDRS
jgi:xylulokinase